MKLDISRCYTRSFKDNLTTLLRKSWAHLFPLSQNHLGQEGKFGESPCLFIVGTYHQLLDNQLSSIKNWPEYQQCVQELKQLGIDGQFVKTKCSTYVFKSENFAYSLISKFYDHNSECTNESIQGFLDDLEEYFKGNGRFRTKTQLVNFSMDGNLLKLNESFQIRKISNFEIELGKSRGQFKGHRYSFNLDTSCYVAEYIETFDLSILSSGQGSAGSLKPSNSEDVTNSFKDLLKSLRVVSSSNVFLDDCQITESIGFSVNDGAQVRYFQNTHETHKDGAIHISNPDDLKKIFKYLSEVKRLRIAIDRLSNSMERTSLIDRLIDLIIGIEGFFQTSGSVHIALRPAFFLEPTDRVKAKEIYEFIDSHRTLRNKIVHASGSVETEVKEASLNRLEEVLRASLQKIILQGLKIPSDAKEWNTIYF